MHSPSSIDSFESLSTHNIKIIKDSTHNGPIYLISLNQNLSPPIASKPILAS